MKEQLHSAILNNMGELCDWFEESSKGLYFPFSSSYDIRDSSFKITNIDANIFPAGFNNICQTDKENAPELIKGYLQAHYPDAKKILLISEDHFKNTYYWENVFSIQSLVKEAGYEVSVGMPGLEGEDSRELESYLGNKITVERVYNESGSLRTTSCTPDVIISNNDFSKAYENWTDLSQARMTPIMEMGWHRRKKSLYFEQYNKTATEFANILDVDPWFFTVDTRLYKNFDMKDESSQQQLSSLVDEVLAASKAKMIEHGISDEPFAFIKNDAGTYGLGVTMVKSGADVLDWTYKARKKMKAQKGGGTFTQVIVQEGVPTDVQSEGATAEPTIYMVGCNLVGGFLRAHKDKDKTESLNSPGAVYKRLCLSDLRLEAKGCPLENVYGWVAKMGLIAIGRETADMGLEYPGYQARSCII